MLPDLNEPKDTIVWGDLTRAADVADVVRPDELGDDEAVREYQLSIRGLPVDGDGEESPVAVLLPEAANIELAAGHMEEFAADVGWNLLEVDRFVERQPSQAAGVMTVLEGSFDEGALTDALGEPTDATWMAGAGESFDRADATPARPGGVSLWLGLRGDHLTVTRSEQEATVVHRSLAGGAATPTLADDEVLADLAEALDAESPYAAMLVRPGMTLRTPEQTRPECEQALPEATAAVGTALADDDGPVFLVALSHDSTAAATANADALATIVDGGVSQRIGRPWSEIVRLDDISIVGDDRVVIARLRLHDSSWPWYAILQSGDSLVTFCDENDAADS